MFSLISCENDEGLAIDLKETVNQNNALANIQQEKVVVSENGYLVFKDQTAYNHISSLVEKMDDQEFLNWEQSLGFLSAQTFLNNVDAQVEKIETLSQFETLKSRYSGKLIFTDDGDIKLPFYATAWSRVLSPEGIMKIGDMLYSFSEDKEISIVDGKYEDIEKAYENFADTTKVKIFYPYKSKDNLKSSTTQLEGNTVYSDDGKSKLTYDLQLISFYYTGYGFSTVYYTEVGYELKFNMLQKRKNWLGIWYTNIAKYYVDDYYFNFMYRKLVKTILIPTGTGGYVEGYIEDPFVYSSVSIASQNTETGNGAFLQIFYYYACDLGYYSQIDFDVYDLDFKFWSSGIGSGKAVTFNKSYSF